MGMVQGYWFEVGIAQSYWREVDLDVIPPVLVLGEGWRVYIDFLCAVDGSLVCGWSRLQWIYRTSDTNDILLDCDLEHLKLFFGTFSS